MNPFATAAPSLHDVQGNILKGHGRSFSGIVLFRFGPDAARSRQLLRDAANQSLPFAITPAAVQRQQAKELRRWEGKEFLQPVEFLKARTKPFRSLALTSAGLKACHPQGRSDPTEESKAVAQALYDRWSWEPPAEFWNGMTAERMMDPGPWSDQNFQEVPHGAWILANDDKGKCETMITDCQALLATYGARVTGIERGQRWAPGPTKLSREPFGFIDGFARTRIAASRRSPLRTLIRRSVNGVLRWARPFDLPLEQVVLTGPSAMAGSSFLVLRKLEQNVREFYRVEQELAPQIAPLRAQLRDITLTDPGALLIGRNRDGTPLTKGGVPRDNTFHFGGDQKATRCPFHAHIRKMNLRTNVTPGHGLGERHDQKAAQFARRGMVYGADKDLREKWENWKTAPKDKVGLLFLGYMSDIAAQFLFMHQLWALDPHFPSNGDDGIDPLLIGAKTPDGQRMEWSWPRYDLKVELQARLITPVGGAYFLIPTLPWLEQQ